MQINKQGKYELTIMNNKSLRFIFTSSQGKPVHAFVSAYKVKSYHEIRGNKFPIAQAKQQYVSLVWENDKVSYMPVRKLVSMITASTSKEHNEDSKELCRCLYKIANVHRDYLKHKRKVS